MTRPFEDEPRRGAPGIADKTEKGRARGVLSTQPHLQRKGTHGIRPGPAQEIKKPVAAYRRFKKMIGEWVALEIERSKIKMEMEKKRED